jgi:hypothetical protein
MRQIAYIDFAISLRILQVGLNFYLLQLFHDVRDILIFRSGRVRKSIVKEIGDLVHLQRFA